MTILVGFQGPIAVGTFTHLFTLELAVRAIIGSAIPGLLLAFYRQLDNIYALNLLGHDLFTVKQYGDVRGNPPSVSIGIHVR
jgi:hypothetical protein